MKTIYKHQNSSTMDLPQLEASTKPIQALLASGSTRSPLSSFSPKNRSETRQLQREYTQYKYHQRSSQYHRFVATIKRHMALYLSWPRGYPNTNIRKLDTRQPETSLRAPKENIVIRNQTVLAWIPNEISHYPVALIKGRLKQFGQHVCRHISLGNASWNFLTGACKQYNVRERRVRGLQVIQEECARSQETAESTIVWHSTCICCDASHACPVKGCETEWRIVRRPSVKPDEDDEVVLDVVGRLGDMDEGDRVAEGSSEDEGDQRARQIIERLRERGLNWEPTALPFSSWGNDRICGRLGGSNSNGGY